MLRALIAIVVNAAGLWLVSTVVPGVHHQGGILALLVAGLVIGLLNLAVKPLVTVFSLPLIILTLGLFYLAINGILLAIAAWLLPGLTIDGCLPALLGGLVMGLFNWLVGGVLGRRS